jgi:8-oxo-dGTP pyrophosphatase MutT (NUDIX family)
MDVSRLEQIITELPSSETIIIDGEVIASSVLLPIIEMDDKLYILVEKRSHKVSQPGEICFPGGRHDKADVTFEETAIRETIEELGYNREDITMLGKLGVLVSHHRSAIHCYVGFIHWKDVASKRYNKEEVEEIMLLDIDELMSIEPYIYKVKVKAVAYEDDENGNKIDLFPGKELGIPEKYHNEWSMGYRSIISYDLGSVKIWGLTGYILRHFLGIFSKT